MALTNAQLATLKADIAADPALAAKPMTSAGAQEIADAYNLTVPAWIVWKPNVPTLQIGAVVSYVAVAAMTTANLDRVRTFYVMNPDSFDPSRSDIRTYMSDTFSGALGGQGQASRDALEALYRRAATRAEKLYSTGTGSTASPATLTFSGSITGADVQQARELP